MPSPPSSPALDSHLLVPSQVTEPLPRFDQVHWAQMLIDDSREDDDALEDSFDRERVAEILFELDQLKTDFIVFVFKLVVRLQTAQRAKLQALVNENTASEYAANKDKSRISDFRTLVTGALTRLLGGASAEQTSALERGSTSTTPDPLVLLDVDSPMPALGLHELEDTVNRDEAEDLDDLEAYLHAASDLFDDMAVATFPQLQALSAQHQLDRRQLLEVHERIRLALKPYEATA
ncbi:hypothetical protein Rhopal_002013-T1 [Rhodotorula paludigena]|uniref:Uncharacterized protein n=1 Tax=Rhodotorula paludigena TaxID=86838 RepID=A0AAV5GGQ0_9BASI|nr:hypothetical protein Rhopal_002013-T1 [Rhodotorula paludigena]